jgi:hypothetical protein
MMDIQGRCGAASKITQSKPHFHFVRISMPT